MANVFDQFDEKPAKAGPNIFDQFDSQQTAAPTGPALSRTEKFMRGLKDPLDAGAQLLEQSVPESWKNNINEFNNWLADYGLVARVGNGGVTQQIANEIKDYEARRKASGESGLDGYRMAGNIVSTLPLAAAAPAGAALGARVGIGAATGAVQGVLNPVTSDSDYWGEKAKQAVVGAAFGGITPIALSGVARVIAPNAASNEALAKMKDMGIKPTIGEALGGRANVTEEKLMSQPFVGGTISNARARSIESFNNSVINDSLKHIGAKVEGSGSQAVREAGDLISQHYDDAINSMPRVKFDAKFEGQLLQLRSMVNNLPEQLKNKFNSELNDRLINKIGPQGTMLPDLVKEASSGFKATASRFGKSSDALQQDLGDAFKQLESILMDQVKRNSPKAEQMINDADAAWAKLVRIEGASKAAMNNGGIFTPAQLNTAIRMADDSVRKRATARGTALLQDVGDAAQKVIGNKYPDSGTAGRMVITSVPGLAIGAGLNALASGLYTKPVQNFLVKAVSERPEYAAGIAQGVRNLTPFVAPAAFPLGNALLNP